LRTAPARRRHLFASSLIEIEAAAGVSHDSAVNRPETNMSKTHPLGFRIERDIKEALIKAAKEDHRSVSSLVELVLARWLRERGYLHDITDKAA
jgi:hypothetical protein